MDAGVAAGFLQLAARDGAVKDHAEKISAPTSKKPASASGCGGALATKPHTILQHPARATERRMRRSLGAAKTGGAASLTGPCPSGIVRADRLEQLGQADRLAEE